MSTTNVKIVWKRPGAGTQTELWLVSGRYFFVEVFYDGVAQVFTSDAEGHRLSKFSIVGHNTCGRPQALEMISELGYYYDAGTDAVVSDDVFKMLRTAAMERP